MVSGAVAVVVSVVISAISFRLWTCVRSFSGLAGQAVGLFDRVREVGRCFLRQVVADAAGKGPVRVLAREPRGVGGGIGVRRTVRIAFERDRWHADRREGREPLF